MLLQLGQTDCWLTLGDSERSFPLLLHWRQWDFVKVCFVSEIYTKICIVCQTNQLHLKLKPLKKNILLINIPPHFLNFVSISIKNLEMWILKIQTHLPLTKSIWIPELAEPPALVESAPSDTPDSTWLLLIAAESPYLYWSPHLPSLKPDPHLGVGRNHVHWNHQSLCPHGEAVHFGVCLSGSLCICCRSLCITHSLFPVPINESVILVLI